MNDNILSFSHVWKSYDTTDGPPRHALHDVSFTVPSNSTVAVVGRSGSGKTTLLNLAAGIDVPSRGTVKLAGHDLNVLDEGDRTRLRRDTVGFVFQFFHLLPHLTVDENVALPAWIAGQGAKSYADRVEHLLERVGLADRRRDGVAALSGGEMQRVALCRALLRRPSLLLADEPTGSLDDKGGRKVMDLLLGLVRDEGTTLIIVTHSPELARQADEVWRLGSGSLERS